LDLVFGVESISSLSLSIACYSCQFQWYLQLVESTEGSVSIFCLISNLFNSNPATAALQTTLFALLHAFLTKSILVCFHLEQSKRIVYKNPPSFCFLYTTIKSELGKRQYPSTALYTHVEPQTSICTGRKCKGHPSLACAVMTVT
jgi:hypothetical protein